VGKPHGLDGFFHVRDPAGHLLEIGARICVGDEAAEILGRKGTDALPLLRVSLASNRAQAETLRGRPLTVARAEAPALEDDEFWAEDLVGCAVTAGDRALGTVERLMSYPSCEVLVVGELLVPMVHDAIRVVDVTARRIDVDAEFLGI